MKAATLFIVIPALVVSAGAFVFFSTIAFKVSDGFSAAIAACQEDDSKKEECYNALILSRIDTGGVPAGLDMLAKLYETDSDFIPLCHFSTHEIGARAYASYAQGAPVPLSSKMSYCGFGFYHGFLEAMVAETGSLKQAHDFCESAEDELAGQVGSVQYACYHGLGHGVVDGADPERWGDARKFIARGLDVCAQLGAIDSVTEHWARCASGVFNSLAIAYVDPKYKLAPNPKDPYAICREQEPSHVRRACYDQMNGYVAQSFPSFREALRVAQTAEPEYLDTAIGSLAAYESGYILTDLLGKNSKNVSLGDCLVLPDELRTACAVGFASGLIEIGKPGHEYSRAIEVCVQESALQSSCLHGVALAGTGRLNPEAGLALCGAIGKRAGESEASSCRDTMLNEQHQSL